MSEKWNREEIRDGICQGCHSAQARKGKVTCASCSNRMRKEYVWERQALMIDPMRKKRLGKTIQRRKDEYIWQDLSGNNYDDPAPYTNEWYYRDEDKNNS